MATAKIPGLENLLAGYDVFGAFANVDSSRQTLFQEGPNETSLQQRLTSQAAADINNASFHPADLIAKYGTHYVRSLSVGGNAISIYVEPFRPGICAGSTFSLRLRGPDPRKSAHRRLLRNIFYPSRRT